MKQAIFKFLSRRTNKYIQKNRPIIIGITGSVGKTSTTQAITTMLRQKYSVLTTKGNYNTDIGVVMSVFDEEIQTNQFSWLLLTMRVFRKSLGKPQHEVYVLELGTDAPGQLKDFSYLQPDISIVTAVTPEHMEFFKTMEAVAEEEMLITHLSKHTFINLDMVDPKLLKKYARADGYSVYGSGQAYDLTSEPSKTGKREATITLRNRQVKALSPLVANHSLYAVLAAACVADKLGMDDAEIVKGAEAINTLPGRMQILKGIKNSTIIDDTYNSSPEAAKAALNTLYGWEAPQRIALLGMMNELGEQSEELHRQIGDYCDPEKLNLVVTLGPDANTFLARAARARGCNVMAATSPVEAGGIIRTKIIEGAVVLAKGSQNLVYAEEAVKLLLDNPTDAEKLVRQKGYWLPKKRKQFSDII